MILSLMGFNPLYALENLLRLETTAKPACRQAGITLCYFLKFNRSGATLKLLKNHILLWLQTSLRFSNA
jgi:hypothetical protein